MKGYCFYPVPTGHIDGSMRTCVRSATASFGTLPTCSQHFEAMLQQMRQAIWESGAAQDVARTALRVVERRRSASVPVSGRRNRITGKHLTEVAEVYREADEDGRPPTRAVADHFGTSHSTAARWVGLARSRKMLPAACSGVHRAAS